MPRQVGATTAKRKAAQRAEEAGRAARARARAAQAKSKKKAPSKPVIDKEKFQSTKGLAALARKVKAARAAAKKGKATPSKKGSPKKRPPKKNENPFY